MHVVILNFRPVHCPQCGSKLSWDERNALSKWNSHHTVTHTCGLHFAYVCKTEIVKAATLDGSDMIELAVEYDLAHTTEPPPYITDPDGDVRPYKRTVRR